MGSFANAVFSALLGWVQGLVSVIWSAFTGKGENSFFRFIGENWLTIAIILCAAGIIVDFVVYLFRWQPYKVWKTTWRRIKNKNRETEAESEEKPNESIRQSFALSEEREADDHQQEEDDLVRWREQEAPAAEKEDRRITTKAGYTVPEDSPYRRPEKPYRRRFRVSNLLADSGDENDFHYFSPRPIVDQKDAYHKPVYPEKWEENRKKNS